MTRREVAIAAVAAMLSGALAFGTTRSFYERQLDRLAASPLCAAACNVLRAVPE